jgi:cytochrome P450
MEDYVWKRGQREESRKRLEKINQLVDSLVADLKALRPQQDPIQQALEVMLYSARDQYDFLQRYGR